MRAEPATREGRLPHERRRPELARWRSRNQLPAIARTRLSSYGYPEGIALAQDGFGILWESRGTLYVTRDGGTHWTAKPKVAQPETDFGRGAAAFPGGHGLVLLGYGGGQPTRLLATDDYGRTWRLVHR